MRQAIITEPDRHSFDLSQGLHLNLNKKICDYGCHLRKISDARIQRCSKAIDAHGSSACCKDAEIILDTDVNGRSDAFKPAELLLAAIAACMIKGMERIAPMNHFKYRSVVVGKIEKFNQPNFRAQRLNARPK